MQSFKAASLGIGLVIGVAIGVAVCSARAEESVPPAPQPVVQEATHDASMHDTMTGMTSGLEGKSGDAFDEAFIDEMTVHHQGAIDMANLVLETSERPELLKLAENIIKAQSAEITMMQEWKQTWFAK